MTVKEYTANFSAMVDCLDSMSPEEIKQADIPDTIPQDIADAVNTIEEIGQIVKIVVRYLYVMRGKGAHTPNVTFRSLPIYTVELLKRRYFELVADGSVRELDRDDFFKLFAIT